MSHRAPRGRGESTGRVGIVTIDDDDNFGNRLQAYALQRALTRLGWVPELIRNTPPPMARRLLARRAWHAIRKDGPVSFGRRNANLLLQRMRGSRSEAPRFAGRRRAAVADFVTAYLETTEVEYHDRDADEWADRYARVVVGSDQVWNHGFRNAQEVDFLTFVPEERRVAYAASFGVHDIPTFLRARYRDWLIGIPHISVREQRGAEIVEELTGRRVPVVVDPTLLLTREEWAQVQELPGWLRGKEYAVQFFLGGATAEQEAWVRSIAEGRGLSLVDLNDLDTPGVADLGPGGFVAALAQSALVATDSFHAGVFSLLHHRPTVIRSRDETDSRLHTLFDLHGIVRDPSEVAGISTALTVDWGSAERRVAAEREASWQYLRAALGPPAHGAD